YEGTHGLDPRSTFEQALAACERSIAANPDSDKYGTLGVVYTSLAAHEARHGGDPTDFVDLDSRNSRTALSIGRDNIAHNILHYNLGRLWTIRAHYRSNHGEDPGPSVDHALVEFKTAVQRDAARSDALAAMADVLLARARFQRAEHQDARATIAEARA